MLPLRHHHDDIVSFRTIGKMFRNFMELYNVMGLYGFHNELLTYLSQTDNSTTTIGLVYRCCTCCAQQEVLTHG